MFGDLEMDFGDQWTGRIKDGQFTLDSFFLHLLGNAVGTKDKVRTHRYVGNVFNKNGAFFLKPIHHGAVVDNFMADINGGAKRFQRLIDYINGAVYTGAESTGVGEYDLHS